MARNKTAKKSYKTTKNKLDLATISQIEKEFLSLPAKLATQINQKLTANKQDGAKILSDLSQIEKKIKHIETRIQKVSKVKHTATGKNQIAAAKKKFQKMNKTSKNLEQEYDDLTHETHSLVEKQAKLMALSKHLNQF